MKHALRLVQGVRSKHQVAGASAGRASLEALESRVLFSGNVSASVVQGNLNVRGDNGANAIVLDQAGLNAGQVRITAGAGTTINNQADPVVLSGVTHDALVRMGNAIDSVMLTDLSLRRNVLVSAGGGANAVTISNTQVAGNLAVVNRASSSTTTLSDTTVARNLRVAAGLGGQNVTLRAVNVQRTTQVVSSGNGAAIMAIDDSTFHHGVQLRTGNGADIIQLDSRGASQGAPTMFDGKLSVSMNGGDDLLQVGVPSEAGNTSAFASTALFDGGKGQDTLRNFDTTTNTGKRFRIKNIETRSTDSTVAAPTVSSTNPALNATGVARNQKIAATFSEAMDPATITIANVAVTGPGGANVPGSVAYVGTTMTFTPSSPLAANTVYTLLVTTGAKDLAGTPLAGNFTSSFTTGVATDTTAPTVLSTDPANTGTGVALNKKIAATFSEPMDPTTITAANVTVTAPGPVAVVGTVAYAGTTMTFTPTSALTSNTVYTLTITTGAKDLAGNPLASSAVASFTTGTTADTTAPTITATSPIDLQTNVVINKTVAATFSESLDALTVTTANFTLTGPGSSHVTGTVKYDAPSKIASFTPSSNLAPNTTYTARIKGGTSGVKDLAGNALAADKVLTFTTGTQVAQAPINLGSAAAFAVMATSSISSTGATQINGDVGLNPGSSQGIPPSQVNGTVHIDDQEIIQAQSDLTAGYNDAVSRSVTSVSLPGNMGGLTFTS